MPKLPRLHQRDIDLIVAHCDEMMQQADAALVSLRSVPKIRRDVFTERNIDYWVNVKSGMRSAIHQAKQRLALDANVIGPSV